MWRLKWMICAQFFLLAGVTCPTPVPETQPQLCEFDPSPTVAAADPKVTIFVMSLHHRKAGDHGIPSINPFVRPK